MTGPSNEEQYYLELINDARLNPLGNAQKYISSYSPLTSADPAIQSLLDYYGVSGQALMAAYSALAPVAPVAWNDSLGFAARQHSVAMITADQQSHQLPGEPSFDVRDTSAGYVGWNALAENVYAFAQDSLFGHAGFMVDWGPGTDGMQAPPAHRLNVMDSRFTEVGVGVIDNDDPSSTLGAQVVTEDFGSRGETFLLGVAYTDTDGDDFYSPGEGRSDLAVTMGGITADSTSSGGYTLDMANVSANAATITFSGGGLRSAVSFTPSLPGTNIKIDVVNGDTLKTSVSGTLNGAVNIDVLGVSGLSILADGSGQTFRGGPGDDNFNGGGGIDTAVFTGNRADYTINGNDYRNMVVLDNRSGNLDGVDTLQDVERLQFADGTIATTTPGDLSGDAKADVLFVSPGQVELWDVNGAALAASQAISDPLATYRLVGIDDFDGDGVDEPLLERNDGQLFSWSRPAGQYSALAPVNLVVPTGSAVVGTGDFGTGNAGVVLLVAGSGHYSLWVPVFSNSAPVDIGTPGAGWVLKGVADLDNNGWADLVFANDSGNYMAWLLQGSTAHSSGIIGSPGPGWFFEGTGDFNGDGKADLLFENVNGHYAIWDLSGTSIIGGGDIGDPGPAWTLSAIGDYNGDGTSDLLFRDSAGDYATWELRDTAVIGGGELGNPGPSYTVAVPLASAAFASLVITDTSGSVEKWLIGSDALATSEVVGNPGSGWTALASGDFGATGEQDILFRYTDGTLAMWETDDTAHVLGGGTIGSPGANWSFLTTADLNGDGKADILFLNSATGQYAAWIISGTSIIGGGLIGTAAGYTFVAAGDIDGDGKDDMIFRNDLTGSYVAWFMNGSAIASAGTIGSPGGTWQFMGLGDFNSDHKQDMLFEDASGQYAVWDLNGTTVSGGGIIGDPGGTWHLVKIADVNQDGKSDLVFEDSNGILASWLISDTAIVGGTVLASLVSGMHVI